MIIEEVAMSTTTTAPAEMETEDEVNTSNNYVLDGLKINHAEEQMRNRSNNGLIRKPQYGGQPCGGADTSNNNALECSCGAVEVSTNAVAWNLSDNNASTDAPASNQTFCQRCMANFCGSTVAFVLCIALCVAIIIVAIVMISLYATGQLGEAAPTTNATNSTTGLATTAAANSSSP